MIMASASSTPYDAARWAVSCALMPAPRRRLSALARHLRPRCSCEAELAARAGGARVGAIAGGAVRLQATHEAEEEPMVEMSERDKFMLDLNGWLVVENVLSSEEVAALNASLDANWDRRSRGFESAKRKAYDQMHGMLEWPTADAQPFRDLLAHAKVVPYLNTILGRGWRMDHSPFLLSSTAGFEGQVGGGMSVHGSTAIQHRAGTSTNSAIVVPSAWAGKE